ncbi:MAG: hypothetical protein V1767_02840 [Chloroflexota bacterium]
MNALAWYTIIFNGLVIILFILSAAGLVAKPPMTVLEDIAWAVFSIPVFILGILALKK